MSASLHIPGLNAIRFFAASLVIITHVEGFKRRAGLDNIWYIVKELGHQGVNIFFVLSGFLITYLILQEREVSGTIAIKKFYVRRILRIWPLYFLIVFLGYVVLPLTWYPDFFVSPFNEDYARNISLTVLLLPNLVLYLSGTIFCVAVLWSIGVEEQFYAIWPWVMKRFGTIRTAVVGFLAIYGVKSCLILVAILSSSEILTLLVKLLKHDSIIVGCVFAFIIYNKHHIGHYILKNSMFGAAIIVASLLMIVLFKMNGSEYWLDIFNPIFSICYAVVIVNVGFNASVQRWFNSTVLDYLGKISYGIYMYHSIVIAIVITFFQQENANFRHIDNFITYSIAFTGTILLAAISYHFFEKPILGYKDKFAVVKSGS